MKSFTTFLILTALTFALVIRTLAQIINVPTDQPTIQAGINVAVNGDTILVQPGTYVENINFIGKNITVASLFLTTQDTTFISQTIIDGNQNGSVIIFESGEDSTSILSGFTIVDGQAYHGGGIYCFSSSPILKNLSIVNNIANGGIFYAKGGGIYCSNSSPGIENVRIAYNSAFYGGGIYCRENSNPSLENVTIVNNSVDTHGGGMYCILSSPSLENVIIAYNSTNDQGGGICCWDNSHPNLENVTITNNTAHKNGGGIACFMYSSVEFNSVNRCNIYLNNVNNKGSGSEIYSYYCDIINVTVDTFTVLNPTDFHASPINKFTFDILYGIQNQVNSDLFVSPEGDNGNSGLSAEEPLKTIQYACSIIFSDYFNPHTIYLLEGTYSPSVNGEFFPISLPDYVSLTRVNNDSVILDAEGTASVIQFYQVGDVTISNITITNGNASHGGGIHCMNSSPKIEKVNIVNNISTFGGGIFIYSSSPSIENVSIVNNTATAWGGGIYCYDSSPNLINVIIVDNMAGEIGGGIYCVQYSDLNLVNVTIANNNANVSGGGIYCRHGSSPSLVNCIMWNDIPEEVFFSSTYDPNTITIAYSDIMGGFESIVVNNNGTINWLDGNIKNDPLFINSLNNDYSLAYGSPCINSGNPDTTGLNLPEFDLSGNPRIYDDYIIDMGAYEYQGYIININQQPTGAMKCEGDSIEFFVSASGGLFTYQWLKDGINIPSATDSLFSITYLTLSDSGYYHCMIAVLWDTISSDTVFLDVNSLPFVDIIGIPNDTVCINETIILDAGNSGAAFEWSTGEITQQIEVENESGAGGGLQSYWVIVTNNNDCQTTDDIDVYFDPCTGLIENINSISVEIFPNPTNGTVSITVIGFKAKFNILLTNQLGKILQTENVNQNTEEYSSELDLSNYPKGIYFLKVQDSNWEILKIEKIVKN